jgi:predicted house-cleaning noncanonical NTP pyrophosphatase (MazG superfamily)
MTRSRSLQPGKLIRDNLPDIMRSHGDEPDIRIASETEYRGLLRDKLIEEAREVAVASDADTPEEMADVLEVVMAIAATLGLTMDELERVRAAKAAERGGFSKRIVWYDDGSNRSAPGWWLCAGSLVHAAGASSSSRTSPARWTASTWRNYASFASG